MLPIKLTGKPIPASNYVAPKMSSTKKDQWDVTFTPLKDGNLSLDLFVNGKPVKSTLLSPLVIMNVGLILIVPQMPPWSCS